MTAAKNALIRLESEGKRVSEPAGRKQRIQQLAYFKALERRFSPGHELDDWLAAEREVDGAIGRSDGD